MPIPGILTDAKLMEMMLAMGRSKRPPKIGRTQVYEPSQRGERKRLLREATKMRVYLETRTEKRKRETLWGTGSTRQLSHAQRVAVYINIPSVFEIMKKKPKEFA